MCERYVGTFERREKLCVTNITLLGLAMVNWSIGLLNPGGDNSYRGIHSCTGPYQQEHSVCQRGNTILPGSAARQLL